MGYVIGVLVYSIICGFVCLGISSSRGMGGGFWWGFWLGIIGIIVVAVRPNDNQYSPKAQNYSHSSYSSFSVEPPAKPGTYAASYNRKEKTYEEEIIEKGGWRCPACGKIHYDYVSACSCGEKKPPKAKVSEQKISQTNNVLGEVEIIKCLKDYKELLNAGILTNEEFEKKKAQLLKIPVAVNTPVEEDKTESPLE